MFKPSLKSTDKPLGPLAVTLNILTNTASKHVCKNRLPDMQQFLAFLMSGDSNFDLISRKLTNRLFRS